MGVSAATVPFYTWKCSHVTPPARNFALLDGMDSVLVADSVLLSPLPRVAFMLASSSRHALKRTQRKVLQVPIDSVAAVASGEHIYSSLGGSRSRML